VQDAAVEGEPQIAPGARLIEARYRHSPSFVEVLRQARCSLLVSTYQAGKLISIGVDSDALRFSLHEFDQAMGVALGRDQIAVGTRGQVWFLAESSQLAPSIPPTGTYDRCFLARSASVTGGIQCHELAWVDDGDDEPQLWVVNTLFSCLCTLHPEFSFVPRWRPPFVSQLAAEDRCHLNGLALRDGRPASVTVMARSDEAAGWRADKNRTGTVLDVASGEVVTEGLAMPHSPRWHRGGLLVLNSGHGTLESVDSRTGEREAVASVPGYARGLACYGNLAFVGLSRIRETAVFGGVPIAEHHEDLMCGVGVLDLNTGRTVATLVFESGIEEIFDVQVVPEARCVALTGQRPDRDRQEEIWVVPPEGSAPPVAVAPPARMRAEATDEEVRRWVAEALSGQRGWRSADAVALLGRAAEARPNSAEILNHLGNAFQDSGDQIQALDRYERAVQADPTFGPALQNLGYLLVNRGRTDEGVEHLRQADRVNPAPVNKVLIATALPVIYDSVEDLEMRRGRLEREVANLSASGLQIDTTDTLVPTSFFVAYQGRDDRPIAETLGRVYGGPDLASRRRRPKSPDRPRVGFLSAYFRDHTIGRLNVGRIAGLSSERFETVVLAVGRHNDPLATRFEEAADRFVLVPREVSAARRLIAEQDLDLLFFTEVGMDALSYTLAFSRMAPVQCATWGHPTTTGSEHMDLFLSSELLEVADADGQYTEELLRPQTLATFYERPIRPEPLGSRAELSLDAEAHLYACPQTLYKLHPEFDRLLAEILRRDPKGLLLLIEGRAAEWTAKLRSRFARTMPDVADRIRWLKPLPREDFLRLLGVVDVVLDPTHFGGGNSSYEALAMGTPVVTLPGDQLRNRITRALYAKAGYMDLVADDEEGYIELAVRLGSDPDFNRSARARIAEVRDALFDDPDELVDFEDALYLSLSL
jgi:uncharacterized protein (TIGR03032 family)